MMMLRKEQTGDEGDTELMMNEEDKGKTSRTTMMGKVNVDSIRIMKRMMEEMKKMLSFVTTTTATKEMMKIQEETESQESYGEQ
ncbi:hypothetical protein Pcinc_019258 [Petrolisthes cinctipes]|uniref:Uncharacterized protein n=1 Tax=Petrolisthes cinctipes TaxID=88211 RepID=A0AAE1FLS1_PETCI|nr:hypothetical protein Pcinc_019258 [Petrolisthes cinctipes]